MRDELAGERPIMIVVTANHRETDSSLEPEVHLFVLVPSTSCV